MSNRSRPISEVIKDETTSPRVKALLAEIPQIKKFGESYGIRPTSNYIDYVALKRPAATWVVSACDPLEFRPREWRFPIVGSFTYLGWFDRQDAEQYAQDLRKEDLDVDVRGARAYSTLGWFRDAVLSSMIPEGEEALGDLVNVILHESVHATLYLSGQSYFNESIASFIADQLTPIYIKKYKGTESKEYQSYLESESEGEKRQKKFHEAYLKLKELYDSSKSRDEKLTNKSEILASLKLGLNTQRDINNATLIQFRTYGVGQSEYSALFRSCGEDWERFWKILKKLESKSFSKEQQEDLAAVILPMAKSGCNPN